MRALPRAETSLRTIPTAARHDQSVLAKGWQAMTGAIRGADLSKGWLPVAAVVAIAGAALSFGWGAATVNNRLDEQSIALERLSAKVDQLPSRGEVDLMDRDLVQLQRKVEAMEAWISTTRIKLAEQGYQTPPYPREPER